MKPDRFFEQVESRQAAPVRREHHCSCGRKEYMAHVRGCSECRAAAKRPSRVAPQPRPRPKVERPVSKFTCEACDPPRVFDTQQGLSMHNTRAHSGKNWGAAEPPASSADETLDKKAGEAIAEIEAVKPPRPVVADTPRDICTELLDTKLRLIQRMVTGLPLTERQEVVAETQRCIELVREIA